MQADESQEKIPINNICFRYRHAILIITTIIFVNIFRGSFWGRIVTGFYDVILFDMEDALTIIDLKATDFVVDCWAYSAANNR
jgi:hypothetical protein